MEILVIGPEPPCIRCNTVHKFAKEVGAKLQGEVEVRRISAHSEEAKKYGKVETGHVIAEMEKVDDDYKGNKKLMQDVEELQSDEEKNKGLIAGKLQELQEKLTPIRKKAEEAGYLMTPVVVVNGKVKSMGYVPEKEKIKEWVESELRQLT
jgi:hypothetical protein